MSDTDIVERLEDIKKWMRQSAPSDVGTIDEAIQCLRMAKSEAELDAKPEGKMSDTDIASPYRDCGKCPYLGGCSNCEHPELREAVYRIKALEAEVERLRAGRAAVWEECRETCAKVADKYAEGDDSDIVACAQWIGEDIRALEVPNE